MQKYSQLFHTISYADPNRKLIAVIAVLSVSSTVSSLLFPLLTQEMIDSFSTDSSFPIVTAVFLIGILLLGAMSSGLNYYFLGMIGNRMLVNIRKKTLRRGVYLPVSYFDSNPSAEPASRIVNDTELVNGLVSQQLEPVISGTLTLTLSVFVLWYIDWRLTSILFCTLFIAFAIVIPIAAKLTNLSKFSQEKEAEFLGRIVEYFSQLRLIKASNAEWDAINSSGDVLDELYQIKHKEVKIGAVIAPIAGITIVLTLVIILSYGAARVNEGLISIGTLVAFILYIFNIVSPLAQLTSFNISLNKAVGASERIQELLALENEIDFDGDKIDAINKDIVFENISFKYSDDSEVFSNFSLSLSANETIAFVGESGAGKSTLFSLLLRYYSPDTGAIKVAGSSIGNFDLASWRSQLSYIQQDSPLLSGSILENLVLGMDDFPDAEIIDSALAAAHLKEFIDELPEGLDTQVGERGSKLSGGQKQRLGIARAILANSPILLCDEATSNLDSITEYGIKEAMKNLTTNRTTLIAAHRLSTVIHADRIVVLKGGEIIADGTHSKLMKTQSYYRDLVEHQLKVFDDKKIES